MGKEYLEKEFQEGEFKHYMNEFERKVAYQCIACGKPQREEWNRTIECCDENCPASHYNSQPNFLLINANLEKVAAYRRKK